jgi:hypothetical protein
VSADIALLEVRHEALKTLVDSLKSEDVSVKTLGAIWTFGVADTILGQDPDPHAAALSKMQKFQNRKVAMLRAIESAYRYWSTPELVTRQTLILWNSSTEQRLDLPMAARLYCDIAEISELRSVQSNLASVPGSKYNWFCLSLDYDEDGVEKGENVVRVSTEEALFIQSVRREPWCDRWLEKHSKAGYTATTEDRVNERLGTIDRAGYKLWLHSASSIVTNREQH